ncbi:MAG: alkaline phosphatase family protein [Anaerolineales bacterium]
MPSRLIILDIDGLRRDVYLLALAEGSAPALSRLVGGAEATHGLHLEPVSNAPSITFCCQASMFTGAHPEQHGIMGNQFFDRFGLHNQGVPRFYAFDVGDTLAVDDALAVFNGAGLVNAIISPETPTLYERAAARGLTSTVANNMIARGATRWLRPTLIHLARFFKGGWWLELSSEAFDAVMIDAVAAHLHGGARPDVLTAYFLGLDHESHIMGPAIQYDYLTQVVDAQVAQLTRELERYGLMENTLFVIVSDHGQLATPDDAYHSLRLSFPFDREMGYLFDALGLDVHDLPGEDPHVDAVVASNGGLAHVYLQHRAEHWADPPRVEADVLRVARAFAEANRTGQYAEALRGALAMMLVRNVEEEGWDADYRVLTPDGQLTSSLEYLAAHPEIATVDAVNRLRHLASPVSGDLVLMSNYADGFYFSPPLKGMHGGLHPEESECVLSFGWPDATPHQIALMRQSVQAAVYDRCRAEGQRRTGLVDMVPAVSAIMGW